MEVFEPRDNVATALPEIKSGKSIVDTGKEDKEITEVVNGEQALSEVLDESQFAIHRSGPSS